MIVVTGRFKVTESDLAATLEAAAEIAAPSRQEPGCLRYRFGLDTEDPLTIQLFEQWESASALDAHFATPHFRAFAEILVSVADGPAEFDRYEVSSVAPLS